MALLSESVFVNTFENFYGGKCLQTLTSVKGVEVHAFY